ncbi:9804_t:CDS:2, partial [Ambispora leptoticha]
DPKYSYLQSQNFYKRDCEELKTLIKMRRLLKEKIQMINKLQSHLKLHWIETAMKTDLHVSTNSSNSLAEVEATPATTTTSTNGFIQMKIESQKKTLSLSPPPDSGEYRKNKMSNKTKYSTSKLLSRVKALVLMKRKQ